MIEKEDLWDCLFGGVGQRNTAIRTLENDPEIRQHLAAEAAQERLAVA
jgi:E3 ubiquitin-protein ligase SHPRH